LVIGLFVTATYCVANANQQNAQPPTQQTQQRDQPQNQQQKKEAFLGVSVDRVPDAVRSQFPSLLPDDQGVLVTNVVKDSPASKAGIQANDVLLKIGDQKLTSPEQLVKVVRSNAPGQTVETTYVRGGKAATTKATLGENPYPMALNQPGQVVPGNPNIFRLFPDERFLRMFEENEVLNGDKKWTTFDSMKLTRSEDNKWSAEIEYRTKDGKKESKKFSGTRQELRKQIQEEKNLPDTEKHHLLRALNLQPPIFEFEIPAPGTGIQTNPGQRP
jgi:membrane-associated protease RseP (regulator of RpoE activity)